MDGGPPQGYTDLAQAINAMRLSVLLTVSVVGLIAFAMWLWARRAGLLAFRSECAKRILSEDRLTDTLVKLQTTVAKVGTGIETMNREHSIATEAILNSLLRTDTAVRKLANKINNRLSVNDSARIVSNAFEQVVYREICIVVERALRENDYANRQEYVERKVKTQIGDVLVGVRETLSTYPLGLSVATYFPIDETVAGERFVLCTIIWGRINRLFQGHAQVGHRIEEAFLLIENTMRDYVADCYMKITEDSPPPMSKEYPSPVSRTALRTPLPEAATSDTDLRLAVPASGEFARPGSAAKTMMKRLGLQ